MATTPRTGTVAWLAVLAATGTLAAGCDGGSDPTPPPPAEVTADPAPPSIYPTPPGRDGDPGPPPRDGELTLPPRGEGPTPAPPTATFTGPAPDRPKKPPVKPKQVAKAGGPSPR